MESIQYCQIKSPEEYKKEMEDLTKKELEKLTIQIQNMPELLRPSEADQDLSISSDSDSSYSSNSSNSYNNFKHIIKPKNKKNDNNLVKVLKKDNVIDNLEKKNYYKTLELSNLTLENTILKKELIDISEKAKSNDNILNLIVKFIELNNIKFADINELQKCISLKEITNKMMEIQKKYDDYKTQLEFIKKEFDCVCENDRNIKLKTCYLYYINNLSSRSEIIFNKHSEILNQNINNLQSNTTLYYLYYIMAFVVLIFSIRVFI